MYYDVNRFIKSMLLSAIAMSMASIGTLSAQSLTKEVTYGDSDEEYGVNAATTMDGGVVQIGYTESGTSDQLYVVRSDVEGKRVWEKIYDITYIENQGAIREAANGDLIWTATVKKTPTSKWDIMVCRTDPDGVIQWMKLVGENNNAFDFGASIIEAANGDIIVCGTTDLFGQDKTVVVRLEDDGTLKWSYFYGSTLQDEWASDLLELPSGDIVVAGTTGLGFSSDGLLYSISDDGLVINWSQSYGDADALQSFSSITTNSNGELYACGSWYYNSRDSRIYIVAADPSSGALSFSSNYSYQADHRIAGHSISRSATTDYLVLTGSIEDAFDASSRPMYFLEVDDALTIQQFRLYGIDGVSVGTAIEYTPGDPGVTEPGYWISGHSSAFSGSFDYYQVRSNLTGYTLCARDDGLEQQESGEELNFPLIMDVYSGTTNYIPGDNKVETDELVCPEDWVDPWHQKQGLVHNDPSDVLQATAITQLQLYPNPALAENEVKLQITVPHNTDVLVTLRDIHGKPVLREQRRLVAGDTTLKLDTDDLSAGVYLLQVSNAGFHRTLQLTVQR